MTSAYETGQVPQIQVHHRLRIAREWANLEQAELAERMGISRTSVSAAEKGHTSPRRITLNAWHAYVTRGQAPAAAAHLNARTVLQNLYKAAHAALLSDSCFTEVSWSRPAC